MLCPENIQIVEGHEPVASNALADTSDAICLKGCKGVLILVHEDYAVDANQLVLTVHEGATATEAAAGTYEMADAFPIWVNLTAQTADTWTRETTDANTYTINATAGDNVLVAIYVPAGSLTNGRDWVHLGAAAGDAGNLVSVLYLLDSPRYAQTTIPTAIA